LPKTKSTPAKECLTSKKSKGKGKKVKITESKVDSFCLLPFYFFPPSFAGIIPSRFIGSFLSFRPAPAIRSPGLFNFSAHLITDTETLDKNFFRRKPSWHLMLFEYFH